MSSNAKGTTMRWWIQLGLAVVLACVAALPTMAQTPTPEQIRDLLNRQRQQSEGRPVVTPSPLDRARERAQQEAERQGQAVVPLKEQGPLSLIEEDYNRRLGLLDEEDEQKKAQEEDEARNQADSRAAEKPDEQAMEQAREKKYLRQFGYAMFRGRPPAPDSITGRLPDDYVLGVGDELVVSFVGSTNRTLVTRVDREGRVVLPELPPLPAAGRTFADFRDDLERTVKQALLGTDAFISVGALRQIGVTVVGEVAAPGVYQVTNLTDVIQVLAIAGGVKKSGTLRNIVIDSNGTRRRVDLYHLMAGTADTDLRLRDGDRVIVPLIGRTTAIAGAVVRPAIYELADGEEVSVADLLALAGGPLRPRGYIVQRNRIDAAGRQHLQSVAVKSGVEANDAFAVYPARDLQTGYVRLEGHVRQDTVRALAATPTVAALLADGEALEEAPYLPFAVLETTDDRSLQRVQRVIDLGPIVAGAEDITLKDRDRLIVFGPDEIAYLSSQAVRGAILAPDAVPPRACKAVVELAKRAKQADTERLAAAARSVFVVEESRRSQNVHQAEAASADEVISVGEIAAQAREGQRCDPLFDGDPGLLPLAVEHAVIVSGAVREPGLYPIADQASLRDLVVAAGGLSLSADPSSVEITTFRSSGGAGRRAGERRYVDLHDVSLAAVEVAPGSVVRFAARAAALESGTVLLSGEFRRPGVYTIRKGETLLSVIERAGGLTDQAYPFGAVFTRVRVKQQQEESFRRTARELNNALALAMLQNNVSGDALSAAQGLVGAFASVEAAGRVVVEADPAMLELEPAKDLVLEGGDALFMPKRPNFVIVAGDVLNPGALQFEPGKEVEDYLEEAGGFQETADKGRVFVVYPNGVAKPVTMSLWTRSNIEIVPGTTIVVPKDVNPFKTLNIVRDITQVLSSLAVSAASIAVISR